MSQISNEINELIKQRSKLQKILTSEDDDPYACEAYNPKNEGGLYGWICPKCGAVMSPYTACCIKCNGDTKEIKITYKTESTSGEFQPIKKTNTQFRCHKCIHFTTCLSHYRDKKGTCPDYKRDPPDGGYYG